MPLKSVSYPYLSSANMIHFRPRKKLISSAGSSGSSGNRRRLTSRHREFESYQAVFFFFSSKVLHSDTIDTPQRCNITDLLETA